MSDLSSSKLSFPSVSIRIPELKCGDRDAWSDVLGRFRIGLECKARQLIRMPSTNRKRLNAEDLVQETLLRAWRGRSSFRGETTGQLVKWMLTILKHVFLDICKRKELEQSQETWHPFPGKDGTPSEIMAIAEEEAEILVALEKLKPSSQRVIAMRIFEGLSFQEISKRTETNINTVCGIYRRGIARMSKIYDHQTCQPGHNERAGR